MARGPPTRSGSAALCFAALVLVYLWPALVGGELLAPLSSLYGHVPWIGQAPPDVAHYLNPLLSDVALADYPWRYLARELLRAGTFPAWNPHVFAGMPFFANPQTMLLTPFSVPLWVLPLNYGLGVSTALMLWTAAFGTYLLVRELGLGPLPGLLAGTAYAFCSFHVVWLTYGTLLAVSALLPWMLWLVERVLRRGGLGPALGLAVATAVSVAGGHPGTQVHVIAAAGLYAVARAAALPDLAMATRGRRLGLACGGLVAGVLLVAVILVPELYTAHGTLVTNTRLGGSTGLHMPVGAIRTVLFPDWWGRPSGRTSFGPAFHAQGQLIEKTYNERTFYPGAVALLIAMIALVSRGGSRGGWRAKAPFVALGVLGLAIPLHAPGLIALISRVPGLDRVPNERLHVVFELATAVLAAFGLEHVLARVGGERRQLVAPALGLGAALVALVLLGPGGRDARQVLHHFLTGDAVEGATALALTSIAWLVLLAAGLGVLLVAAHRLPRHASVLCAAIVVLAAGDMLHFARGYQPMAPASKMIPPRTPAIAYLQRHVGDARIMGIGGALPNDWSLVYGFDDVRGYDPPYPTLRYYHLWRAANPEQGNAEPLRMQSVDPRGINVLSVLGARYIVSDPGLRELGPPEAELSGLRRVYAGGDATIFVNDNAPRRVLVPRSLQVVAREGAAVGELADGLIDPRRAAVVERSEPGAATLARAPVAHGTASVVEEANARVTLRARLDRRGLVVLNDALIDGWTVQVDGHPAPAVRVNEVMRGVIVAAGTHRIVWRYTTPGIRLGTIVSLLTLVALLAAGGWLLVRARRVAAAY